MAESVSQSVSPSVGRSSDHLSLRTHIRHSWALWCVCDPSSGEAETPLASSHPSLLGEFQVSESPCLNKRVGSAWGSPPVSTRAQEIFFKVTLIMLSSLELRRQYWEYLAHSEGLLICGRG